MKIFLNDIKRVAWLKQRISEMTWGKHFLELKSGFYFVFNYNLAEEVSGIEILTSKQVYEINDGVYRNLQAEHIGYMREPFETSNYLFYSILKSTVVGKEEEDMLVDMFLEFKSRDIAEAKANLKESIKGNLPVVSRISFSTALTKIFSINPDPVHGLCMVYDLIDQYAQRSFGKTIYGDYLTHFVRAVKNPNGGLLPEYPQSTMRYLIIGEVAAAGDESLHRAKELLRSGNSPKSIYLETGWFFNKQDKKWRKRVSDDTFFFDMDKINTDGSVSYFLPKGYTPEQFKELSSKLANQSADIPTEIMKGYNVRLSDFISFEEAFNLYPELKDIYGVFSIGLATAESYAFYFQPNLPHALVLITGENFPYDIEKVRYTALHEIQHYVQSVEGFGTGGNETLANLVDSVGGSSIRSFYISLNAFQQKFKNLASMIPVGEYKKLVDDIVALPFEDYKIRYRDRFINASDYIASVFDNFQQVVSKEESINYNASSIGYYIVSIYSMVEETNSIIDKFVSKHIGSEYIDLFKQALSQNKKAVERDVRLSKHGWTAKDLYILNFQTYESLMGEVEARFTQQTSKIPKPLADYFDFYTSETIDPSRVAVLSDNMLFDEKEAEAGIETRDGKYIIHLPDDYSNSVNILHETGHIFYDFEKDAVLSDAEAITDALMKEFKSVEEYFCASFVDYIHRKNIDPMLTADLDGQRSILDYNYFDKIFDTALFTTSEINEEGIAKRLEFVKMIAEVKEMADGGDVDGLEKELHKLQRELNSSRLLTYREGDESEEEMARQRERASKLARFNEVLKLLREKDGKKYADGGNLYKKGQTVKINTDELEKEQHDNFLIQYNALPKNVRDNDFYKKHFDAIKKDGEEFILKLKKENPKITEIVDHDWLNIVFSDGTEAGMQAKFII